ncbi:MAG: hypothetical protein JWN86_1682 [Planctomycetota bacterium]|nr:hypothetical protein [Planctomycetota bacterium]
MARLVVGAFDEWDPADDPGPSVDPGLHLGEDLGRPFGFPPDLARRRFAGSFDRLDDREIVRERRVLANMAGPRSRALVTQWGVARLGEDEVDGRGESGLDRRQIVKHGSMSWI